jgi:hypothetical protein
VVLDAAIFCHGEEANHLKRSLDAAIPGFFKSNEFPNLEDVRHVFIPPVFSRVRVVRGFNKTDDESHGSATASRLVDVERNSERAPGSAEPKAERPDCPTKSIISPGLRTRFN